MSESVTFNIHILTVCTRFVTTHIVRHVYPPWYFFFSAGWLSKPHFPVSVFVGMAWNSRFLIFLAFLYLMNFATAKKQCKTEVGIPGTALKGHIFKKVPVTAPHVCDITCERETICQSYNYVIGEKSCELNTRTKEARPENFQPDDLRFYMGRISGRSMYPV